MKLRYIMVIVVVLVAGAALALALIPSMARNGTNENVREFVLVAKDMGFHVQGGDEDQLTVRPGERVHLTIKNEEIYPMAHNFGIVGLGVRTRPLQPGESQTIELTAGQEGSLLYSCFLHPGLMEGHIRVSRYR
jgi:plastocyanin